MNTDNTDTDLFLSKLHSYKSAIDDDIEAYADHVQRTTAKQFGEYSAEVTGCYLDMLSRGGKRIRGALVMAGYGMCGGRDRQMILRAATAVEMIHAYILIIDDIQDRSKMRRGQPTVHEALVDFHREHNLKGDADHVGMSLALNAALSGCHAAQIILAGLRVDPELRLKAIGIVNHTMITTAHGQTADIMNELAQNVTKDDVEKTMEWKTAHYTVLNPLCVGMALAGASCAETDAIRDYALYAGKAFQITDDIIGVFGSDAQTGKSVMDDIREGKRTLLTLYALEHAAADDRSFLLGCLGNESLTKVQFDECKAIITDSGALDYARRIAAEYINSALEALDSNKDYWTADGVEFLRSLAMTLAKRES